MSLVWSRRSIVPVRSLLIALLAAAAAVVLGSLVWQGITAGGNPDPTAGHLSTRAVVLDTGLLVFREGLEAILVLSAVIASFRGGNLSYRRPVAAGAGAALLASLATWFIAIATINAVGAPALETQAVTGLLAIVVLLVIMNWFFHRIYWTGWISHHTKRRRKLMAEGASDHSRLMLGLAMLGFTAIYREGFEIVLFLQTLRMQAGDTVVAKGVAIGLAFTAVVAALTFVAHHALPYKKMLVLTGVLLGFVLVVMVGENVQELQLAGWMSTHAIGVAIPGWMGTWFALFPNVEGIVAQILAAAVVLGSFYAAKELKVSRPRRHGETPAIRPETAPAVGAD
jgi:high-affinity iron transporter